MIFFLFALYQRYVYMYRRQVGWQRWVQVRSGKIVNKTSSLLTKGYFVISLLLHVIIGGFIARF